MLEKRTIIEHLKKTFCYKCGASMEDAKLETVSEAPLGLGMIAHAVCLKCQAESMVTITTNGGGAIPLLSDLNVAEFKKFLGTKSVSYDDLIDLHTQLKKEDLCNLLQQKEKYSEKKLKA